MDQTDMGGRSGGNRQGEICKQEWGKFRGYRNGKERVTGYGAQGWDRWSHSTVEFEGMEVEKQYNALIQQHATGQQEESISNIKKKMDETMVN